MATELFERMNHFYTQSTLAQKVAAPLKEGAVAEVQFEGDPGTYMMIKEGGRSVFKEGKPGKPQIYMKFSKGAIDFLLELQEKGIDDVEEYVTRFATCILEPTPERKIEFKLCANIITGARMGYFGMMRLGGKKALDVVLKMGIKVPAKFLKG
jgi:hypothetical protein